MNIEQRIDFLHELGSQLAAENREDNPVYRQAYLHNNWFIERNIVNAIEAISKEFLNKEKLTHWLAKYDCDGARDKTIGLVFAGNLPLVGFHDLLCAYILGYNVLYKPSSKDELLLMYVLDKLKAIDPLSAGKFKKADILKGFDAVIATGSNNSNRYFEYYFRNYPSILRQNRNSMAVLSQDDSEDDYKALAHDIFQYFGLGCRNVSKLFLPKNMKLEDLLPAFEEYRWLLDHNKYKNNFDYNLALKLLNKDTIIPHDFAIWFESPALSCPVSTVHFEYYNSLDDVKSFIAEEFENIQVIVTNSAIEHSGKVGFGQSQQPSLSDYADNVDVMEFLTSL